MIRKQMSPWINQFAVSGDEQRLKQTPWVRHRASGRPVKPDSRWENQWGNWNSTPLSASIEKWSLGVCPGDAQMGNSG